MEKRTLEKTLLQIKHQCTRRNRLTMTETPKLTSFVKALPGLMRNSLLGWPQVQSTLQTTWNPTNKTVTWSHPQSSFLYVQMAPIPFQHLVAQENFCATRNTYIFIKQIYDRVASSTSYYKPHRKYHPNSIDLPFSLQSMEKIRTSKHIMNTNTLELLWTTGKDPIYSPYSLHAFHSIFC